MLNESNYEELIEKYKSIVSYVKSFNVSREELVQHINKKTPLGEKVVWFLEDLKQDSEDINSLIKELLDMIY